MSPAPAFSERLPSAFKMGVVQRLHLSEGAEATLRGVAIMVGPGQGAHFLTGPHPTGQIYGVRALNSRVTLDTCTLRIEEGAGIRGVWFEDSADSVVKDSSFSLHGPLDITGIHIEGAGASVIGDNQLGVGNIGMGVWAEFIDAEGVTFSARGAVSGDGMKVVRSQVSANVTFSVAGEGLGVLLDTSPHSSIVGTLSGQVSNVVQVSGDATGTVIGLNADVEGHGIEFSDCGGAAPLVTGSSLRVWSYASPEVAIESFGDCHPRIENNSRIVSVAMAPANPTAIHCGDGSLCSISGNADIHVEIKQAIQATPYDVAGIRCESGSCGDIVGNHVNALFTSDNFLSQGYLGVQGHGIIANGGLIAKNFIAGGCATSGAGLTVSGGRIENNFVSAPSCTDSLHMHDTSGAALEVLGAADVHSNTLRGGAATAGPYSRCTAFGVIGPSGASFRNNIISVGSGGSCTTADFAGGVPTVFQNNDLLDATYLNGATLLTSMSAINALGPGFSANFSAPPTLVPPDYTHLAANSACVDAGTAEGAPLDDFEGDPRDDHPDVGADEWNGSVPPDPCLGVTCSGHGVCQASQGVTTCTCYSGYLGSDCSAVDLCTNHHGGCDPLVTCTGFPGGRTCGPCPPDYTGTGDTSCTPTGCANNACQPGGTCTPTDGGGHVCSCRPGVTGSNCELYFKRIAVGDDFTCGLRSDGQIICFGRNDQGQTNVPAGTYTAVSAGRHLACGLRTDRTLACWGYGASGVTSPPSGTFDSVTAGDNYACALNGSAPTCWGILPPPPSGYFESIAVADWHACGIRLAAQNHAVECWGLDGVVPDYGQQDPPAGSFTWLSLNATTSCGLQSAAYGLPATITCWGAGIPGTPSTGHDIALGPSSACAKLDDYSLYCWGADPEITNSPTGTNVWLGAVGAHHACAFEDVYSLRCWGDNTYGQITPPY